MLDPASRFGPYEILAPLGSGGRGDVYRAYDTRLRRLVALKIVRSSPDRDPGHGSLLREASAASALNHPNILVVYDVGIEDGVPFIVSELVDGVALRETLANAPLPVKKLLDIAVQIADGLAAAHEAGIVHRDLKPENVMVTRDGRVKIVDFGVAKIERPASLRAEGARALTETAHGLVLGTAPYMSPEQAGGRPIDFRSDQFSFGLVLYEMVTGSRAFSRDTPVQTLSAIIEDEPPPLPDGSSKTPVMLRWIIERCLAKEPSQRYAATSDVARDLRMLRDRLSEVIAVPGTAASPGRRRRFSLMLISVMVAAGGALLFLPALTRGPDRPRLPIFTPLANDFSYQGEPAWSPTGTMIAYVAAAKNGVLQIYKRSLESAQGDPVTDSQWDCHSPFWSADGSRIYYISQYQDKEGVFSISAAGGKPEPVMPDVVAADLSKDGTLAFLRDEGQNGGAALRLWTASPQSAEPHPYVHQKIGDHVFSDGTIRFSRDGGSLGLWMQNWSGFYRLKSRHAFWNIPMNGDEPQEMPHEIGDLPRYAPVFDWLSDGRRIVAAVNGGSSDRPHLWIIDTKSGATTSLTAGAGIEDMPAVSPNGQRIAYATQEANFDLFEVPIDGTAVRPLLATTRNEMEPAWSPATDEYAFVSDSRGRMEIRRRSHDGSFEQSIVNMSELPSVRASSITLPEYSPDGHRIAYEVTNLGPAKGFGSTIWISTVSGGSPVPMTPASGTNSAPTWSPNSQQIALALGTPEGWSLAVAAVGVNAAPTIIYRDIWPFSRPQWSPDNRWIACNTSKGLTLIAPDGKTTKILDEDLWTVHGWSKDGGTVYGIKRDPEDPHRLMLVAADVARTHLRIINPYIAAAPPANQLVKGFSRMSNGNFVTSLVHVQSDVWLIDDFDPPTTWLNRLWRRLR